MRKTTIALVSILIASTLAAAAAAARADAKETARKMARSFFDRRFEYKQLDGEVTLVRDGKPTCVIVAPDAAAPPVEFAALELQDYLKKISGAEAPIVKTRPNDGAAIVLGDGPEARAAGIDVDALARDGCHIVVKGRTVFIAGKDDDTERAKNLFFLRADPTNTPTGKQDWDFHRGTLYGAYRFLEELGVRWFMPTETGEAVPEAPTVTVRAFTALEEPAFDLRVFGTDRWTYDRMKRFGLVHMDEYQWLGYEYWHTQQFLLRARASSGWYAFNHWPPRVNMEERFAETHPEYFAMLPDGLRDIEGMAEGRTGHMCYTNPEFFKEAMADVDAFFEGKPASARGIDRAKDKDTDGWNPAVAYGDTFSLLPHDSFTGKACTCPTCKPLHRPNAYSWAQHSNLVWPFIARAGEYVQEKHPGKIVACLAYASFTEPPTNLDRLPDNVMVGICPHYLNKTLNLVTPERYERYMDLVRRWSKMNEMPLLFWEHHLIRFRVFAEREYGLPALYPHFFGKYFRDISQYGRMMFVELSVDSLVYEHLNRYVAFKMMLNPDRDVQALLDDYFDKVYGPGAAVAEALFADIEAKSVAVARAVPEDQRYIKFPLTRIYSDEFFGPETLKKYREQADELVRLTKGTRHERAGEMISRFFVGKMEEGARRAKK